ncbi:NUDIX domain-containing protein [Ruminococcus sp. XPD3002]|uniref:NUDIX domain-containing protein n=1 Tax=Ruminococcus sp. XPD3002 TaxID=1452269 RepID=UPI000923ED9C|nr:ADP-ribose pyrophosphatase [Ruminococcus flavefaciens]
MHLNEKTLSSETVYHGKIFDITHNTVELENGETAVRDVLVHHGGVCVIPVTEDNDIYMVKQFRYPFGEVTLEIPAGKLEKGEDHRECGLRELREETGFTCSEYTYIGKIYPVPAYDTEIIHVYMARGLRRQGEQSLDEDEFLDVVKIPLSEAVEMIMSGKLHDSKTQIAVLKVARILGI